MTETEKERADFSLAIILAERNRAGEKFRDNTWQYLTIRSASSASSVLRRFRARLSCRGERILRGTKWQVMHDGWRRL